MDKGVDVEAFYVCDFRRKFASPGQLCQGVHQDSQICDENHIFVMSLARFFCDVFSKFFVFGTHKISFGIAPLRMIGDYFYWTKLDNILAIFSHVECRTKNNRFFLFVACFNWPSSPQFGQPSKFAPAGRAPRAQWGKKELRNKG